jgi:hypothetical protein
LNSALALALSRVAAEKFKRKTPSSPKSDLVRVYVPYSHLLWRTKSEYVSFIFVMPVRSCRVTINDMDGVKHTVEVTAETLYEAVALGLVALRGNDWVMGIAQSLNTIQVSVVDIPIEHSVKIKDFHDWLERTTGAPREISKRTRIKSILGLPTHK